MPRNPNTKTVQIVAPEEEFLLWVNSLNQRGISASPEKPLEVVRKIVDSWNFLSSIPGPLHKGPRMAVEEEAVSAPATMPKQAEPPVLGGKACPKCNGDALLKTADRKLYCLKCHHTWKPEKIVHVKRASKNPSMEEGEQILETIEKSDRISKYEDWTIAWLMLKRGLRLGEIVSHQERTSNLHGIRIRDVSATGIQIKGKKEHEDFCPLPENIIARIRQQIGTRTATEERVFMVGLKAPESSYDQRFKRFYLKHSGVENWQQIHPHSFRHTFGFEAADKTGGNPYHVRDLMRHKSIQMSTVYVQTVSEAKKKTILDKMDGMVEKAVERNPSQDERGVLVKPSTVPQPLTPLPMNPYAKSLSEEKEPASPAPSNVPHEERVGPEKIPEPIYPLKPAPPVDSGPSVKVSLPALPSTKAVDVVTTQGPHAIPDGSSYHCSEGDANGYSKETIEKHIKRMHPPPDRNKLEGWA